MTTLTPDSAIAAIERALDEFDSARITGSRSRSSALFMPPATPEALRLLLAALREAQEDAARYRWLRDVSVPPHNFYISVPVEFEGVKYSREEVDAAIDAARTQEKSHG